MWLRRSLVAIACIPVSAAGAPVTASAQAATVPTFAHVVVIVMENRSYAEVIGSSSAPYINRLAQSGALATNYHGATHPSLPNYLVLTGGSTYGIASDCTTCWISATNIADSLEAAGKTWKGYMESMPSPCFVGDSYPYAQKHNPFVYFNDIRTNSTRCASHVVPLTQLATDLQSAATTPNYAFITPNMCNDMHDCSVATGDSWLQSQVPQILASPAFTTQRSLLMLTWDEDDNTASNQVPLIMVSSAIAAGTRTSLGYNHYSTLSTIDAIFGLQGQTSTIAGAPSISDVFQAPSAPKCGSATLTVSPSPTGVTGIATTLTASSSGCASPVYRFWVRDPGSRWSMVKDYSATATHVWSQTGTAGTYSIEVDVRDASERTAYDAVANLTYVVAGCSSVTLGWSPISPQPRGTTVTLSGSATCPGTPVYRFWVRSPGAAWKIVRDYSTTTTFPWAATIAGTYSLEVDVRDQGSSSAYEVVVNTTFSLF